MMSEKIDAERAKKVFVKMLKLDRMHRNIAENFVSSMGIHRSQHRILMYLSKNKDCNSQKQIADEFSISSAAVAVSLKKLENGGFIQRNISENDNRFNKIELTEKGREMVYKTKKAFSQLDIKMFSALTSDECSALEESLEKMQASLKELADSCTGKTNKDK